MYAEVVLGSNEDIKVQGFRDQCVRDLDFIYSAIRENSAPELNKEDKQFSEWLQKGYECSKELASNVRDEDDCYFALNYFMNGFGDYNIRIRSYIKLPPEFYPGILSVLQGGKHTIIYKNPNLQYLKDVKVGDVITHINDIPVDQYYNDYLLPFYAATKSELDKIKASSYALIVDGNDFIPTPRTLKIEQQGKEIKLDLLFTKMTDEPRQALDRIRNPLNNKFHVDLFSGGAWIRIPTFFPSREEEVFFKGMLASLKDLAKEDYIIFDLRGNRGGSTKWERPILRNLWGDAFIKSLGKAHDYNTLWQKGLRISPENFKYFKQTHSKSEIKEYAQKLAKGDKFYNIKWNIYDQTDNLYNNSHNEPVRAKVYVLTDNFCTGTCWLFVREMLQMPSVTHIGATTGVQGVYSNTRVAKLGSDNFEALIPIQHHIFPVTSSNTAFIPSKIFNGDFRNNSAVVDWVVDVVDKDFLE